MDSKCSSGGVIRSVVTCRSGVFQCEDRELADEISCRIVADGQTVARFSCSPWGVRSAAIGHLFTEGIADVQCICTAEPAADNRTVFIALGKEGPFLPPSPSFPAPPLYAEDISHLAAQLEENSSLYRRTGGVHCAALARGCAFLAYEEDVSRHTAVDKLAGVCLEQGISMENGVLVFSGRVPGEILRKAAAMGCCAVIARSAPTEEACRLAAAAGITLIGFARDDSFNVYTHPERISEYSK